VEVPHAVEEILTVRLHFCNGAERERLIGYVPPILFSVAAVRDAAAFSTQKKIIASFVRYAAWRMSSAV
jgi:hypothetical protein